MHRSLCTGDGGCYSWLAAAVPKGLQQAEESGVEKLGVADSPGGTVCRGFARELDLVAAMIEILAAGLDGWGVVDFGLEFDYRRGRPDIVALLATGEVIAIEAKLRDWRGALQQAYRNTSFAAHSYILMPFEAAQRAAAHAVEFDRRGVGICTIVGGELAILHAARHHDDPLEPWLTRRAAAYASSCEE